MELMNNHVVGRKKRTERDKKNTGSVFIRLRALVVTSIARKFQKQGGGTSTALCFRMCMVSFYEVIPPALRRFFSRRIEKDVALR